MQLSNDILTKFAKTVDQKPESTPVLEFNGVVTDIPTEQNQLAENTCKVKISGETGSDDNPAVAVEECICSTKDIDIVEKGNKCRIKIQNGEAIMITNYDNPANVYNVIMELSAENVTFTVPSQGASTHGYATVELTNPDLDEKLAQGYKITGVNESYYEVNDGSDYVKPWHLSDASLMMEIIPNVSIASYCIEDTQNGKKFVVLFTYVGNTIPASRTYKIVFKVSLARPGILEPEE